MNTEKLDELFHIADRVAKKLASEYPSNEFEDIQQELYTYCIEKQDQIKLFGEGDSPSNPVAYLYREGTKYCQNWVSNSSAVACNLEYSEKELRKQLENCLSTQTVINTYVPEWSKSYRPKHNRQAGSQPLAEWDSIYIGTDVKEHVKLLPLEDRVILWRRFIENDDAFQESSTLRMKVSAAIKRLAHEMNQFKAGKGRWFEEHASGYVGSRQVISNDQANHRSSSEYSGED